MFDDGTPVWWLVLAVLVIWTGMAVEDWRFREQTMFWLLVCWAGFLVLAVPALVINLVT